MGLREFLQKQDGNGRLKVSAGFAVLSHALAFLVGSLSLATQAEYGMEGAQPSIAALPALPPMELEILDISESETAAPVRKRTPQPTLVPTPLAQAPSAQQAALPSSGVNEIPSYFKNPKPPYPEEAQRLGQEGVVLLRVEVDAQGQVTSVAIRQSSGFPLLDEAAQKAVATWRFKPGRMAGIAVSSQVDFPLRFNLEGD